MEKRIAAVVVTYNRLPLLRRCVDALLHQSVPCDVLLVDNASTDETGEWARALAEREPAFRVKNTGANLGGAGGFSFGARWAVEAGYDFLWLMDDDTLPEPDALQRLLEADARLAGNYGWLSSAALWTDGHECRMNRQKINKEYYKTIEYLDDGLLQAVQATFVSLFLRREVVLRVGLPIAEFFIWGDDVEYTRRIAVREKLPCFVAGRSRVVHAMSSNNGSNIATDDPERLARYNYAYRNENYLYRKEGLRGFLYYCCRCGGHFLRVWAHAKNHRLRRSGIIVRQFFAGLFFNPKVAYVKENEDAR